MIDLSDISQIFVGSTEIGAVYVGSQQVWPAAYECTLAPEAWTYGGQYLIGAIPAAGGYASPTRWVFTIKDPVTHQAVHTIYLNSLLTAPTIEEYIGGAWVAAQNFRFTSNQWQADDRGTNGYGSSGSDAPQSAPARQSRMTASYTTTYNNVQCSATYTGSMVQNGNNAVAGTGYFDDPVVSLDRYDSTSDKAPAYQVTTTIFAKADFITPYTFVDAVTGATNPLTYTRIQTDAAQTDDFTFSGPSWVTIGTPTPQGATVTIESRGTDYDTMYRYDRIRATLNGTADYDDVYVYQAANIYTDEVKQYTGASTSISPDPIPATDRSFTVFGYLDYQYKHEYSSGAWDPDWLTDYESATAVIDSVTMDGISYYDFSGNVVSIDENQGLTDIEYETVSHITDPAGRTWSNLTSSATQEGISQQITFGTPIITDFYYPETDGYNIPASGGAVNPVVVFQIEYSINGVHDNSMVLSGSVDEGENHGTLDDGVAACDYDIYYRVGGQSSSDGEVSANSRGTNPDPDGTTTIQLATNCYAYVRMDGKNSSNSSSETVTQQANHEESTEEFNQTYSVVDLDFVWNSHNAMALSAGETGYLTWAECKEYYYIRTWYTSGGHIDGQTQYERDIDADASESASWLTTSGYYVTAERNTKSGGERSATVYAVYGGNTLGSVTVTQAETIDWYTLESAYSTGLSFTAAGGNQTVTFTGYHRYDNGDSPDTTASPGVSVIYDGDVSGRISNGGTQGRTITANNLGTDPYDEVNTYYTYRWTLHSEATCDIPVYQGPNEPGNFGTVSFPDPPHDALASGSSIKLNPTCSCVWTSGSSGTVFWDAFDFTWAYKPNQNYRDYDLDEQSDGVYATYGSLGTQTTGDVNSRITATLKADSSKHATAVIQELENVPVGTSLSISWSIGLIPSYGGSSSIGVASANLHTTYSSGDTDSGTPVPAATILNNTTASGSNITYTHSYGDSTASMSATANEGSSPSARELTLTTVFGGATNTETQIVQQPVAYRTKVEPSSGVTYAYIRNADSSNAHAFEYTVTVDGADTTGTASFNAGDTSWRTVGATPSSGHIITVVVDSQDGHSIVR